MTSFFFVVFLVLLSVPLIGMFLQPGRAFEYPFFMAATFAVFILPQAFSLIRFAGGVAEQSVNDVLLMSVLCLAFCMIGYRLTPKYSLLSTSRKVDSRKLFYVGVIFVGLGYLFGVLLRGTEIQIAETGGMTGTATILLFFEQLIFPGFAICFLLALKRPTFARVIASVAGIIPPLETVFSGRREPTVLLGMTLMLGLFYGRRMNPPCWLIPVAIIMATVAIPATGTYRSLHAERDWAGLKQMDLYRNFKKFLNEESILELRNAAAMIESVKATGNYEYGAGYWNHLVFRYVPAQILGTRFKDSLRIQTGWDIVQTAVTQTGFELSRGSTITGMGDAFQQFGWFGCLFFGLMGMIFRNLWAASLQPKALFAQLLYMSSCTTAMRAVTHWTLDFLPGLLYNILFLGLALIYASPPSGTKLNRSGRKLQKPKQVPSLPTATNIAT